MEKIEFGQGILRVRQVFPVSIILSTSLIITISMLLVSEGQASVVWKPANKATLFQMSGSTGQTSALTVLAANMLLKGPATGQFDQEFV
jgi:predicted secreted Zn-dependent protease